jgi:autotransporter strand-loop-strand O-heptosyltransferase
MFMDNLIKAEIKDNGIVITNKTGNPLSNLFVTVENIFFNCLCDQCFELKPNETISLPFRDYVFDENNWRESSLYVKVYGDNNLIFEKTFNDKTKCFVLLSNEAFEKLTEQLIIGLTRYTTVDIKHYTIGYKSKLKYDYLENIETFIEGDINDTQFIQFIKPTIFCDIIERGYINAVFLDSDIQVKSNINDIFNFIPEIEHGPIFQKSYWDFTMVRGEYIPGVKLSKFLGITKQEWGHGVTNVVLFNKTHYDLFLKWKKICLSDEINTIRKEEFLHDELILNCMMWKEKIVPKFFNFSLNVVDESDVEFFYEYDFNNYEYEVNLNEFNKGHLSQSHFYYDRSNVFLFHLVKDPSIAEKINEIIYTKEVNKMVEKENIYSNIKKSSNIIREPEPTFNINFNGGAFVEIKDSPYEKHIVKFINKSNNLIEHEGEIGNNCWIKTGKSYFIDWLIEIHVENKIYKFDLNLENKHVYIALDSKSIGDTIAWFPFVEEFRKKHGCKISVSTFNNDWFEVNYPELNFVKPGEIVHGIYAMYTIGWYYDGNQINYSKVPIDFREKSLQETASSILGLDKAEIKPKINVLNKQKNISGKYAVIAPHASAHAKYWNKPGGWQAIVDYLDSIGYKVLMITQEKLGDAWHDSKLGGKLRGVLDRTGDLPMQERFTDILNADLFIGVGSGLSWVSWALGTKTIMISGFSYPHTEFEDCIRVFNDNPLICGGCFNRHQLNPSDWEWCPDHKNTERMFECTKTIEIGTVIDAVNQALN